MPNKNFLRKLLGGDLPDAKPLDNEDEVMVVNSESAKVDTSNNNGAESDLKSFSASSTPKQQKTAEEEISDLMEEAAKEEITKEDIEVQNLEVNNSQEGINPPESAFESQDTSDKPCDFMELTIEEVRDLTPAAKEVQPLEPVKFEEIDLGDIDAIGQNQPNEEKEPELHIEEMEFSDLSEGLDSKNDQNGTNEPEVSYFNESVQVDDAVDTQAQEQAPITIEDLSAEIEIKPESIEPASQEAVEEATPQVVEEATRPTEKLNTEEDITMEQQPKRGRGRPPMSSVKVESNTKPESAQQNYDGSPDATKLAFEILDHVSAKVLTNVAATFSSKVYTKEYTQYLIEGFINGEIDNKNPLLVQLLKEIADSDIQDPYVGEFTGDVIDYIIRR